AGAWFAALSRGARRDQGSGRAARVGPDDVSEPERDRSVDDLGARDEIADAAAAEIAGERPQGDAGLDRADDGKNHERHRERMGSAEQRGHGSDGEDGVPPQAGEDSRRPPRLDRDDAQASGALPEGPAGAEQRIGGEQQQAAEHLTGTRLPARNEHERREPDQQIDGAGPRATAEVRGRKTGRLSGLQRRASCPSPSTPRSPPARQSLWGLPRD